MAERSKREPQRGVTRRPLRADRAGERERHEQRAAAQARQVAQQIRAERAKARAPLPKPAHVQKRAAQRRPPAALRSPRTHEHERGNRDGRSRNPGELVPRVGHRVAEIERAGQRQREHEEQRIERLIGRAHRERRRNRHAAAAQQEHGRRITTGASRRRLKRGVARERRDQRASDTDALSETQRQQPELDRTCERAGECERDEADDGRRRNVARGDERIASAERERHHRAAEDRRCAEQPEPRTCHAPASAAEAVGADDRAIASDFVNATRSASKVRSRRLPCIEDARVAHVGGMECDAYERRGAQRAARDAQPLAARPAPPCTACRRRNNGRRNAATVGDRLRGTHACSCNEGACVQGPHGHRCRAATRARRSRRRSSRRRSNRRRPASMRSAASCSVSAENSPSLAVSTRRFSHSTGDCGEGPSSTW